MKIDLENAEMRDRQRQMLADKLRRYHGLSRQGVQEFEKEFQDFLSNPGIVEMHVFTSVSEVLRVAADGNAIKSDVLRDETKALQPKICGRVMRKGFCIAVAKTKKKACSQLQLASTV